MNGWPQAGDKTHAFDYSKGPVAQTTKKTTISDSLHHGVIMNGSRHYETYEIVF